MPIVEHFFKNRIGIALAAIGTFAVLIIDPSIDDDFGLVIVAKKQSVLLEKFEVDDFVDELGMRLGDALLTVHRSYLKTILAVSASADVHGFAHITGGGIVGNTNRVIPSNCSLKINWKGWERPAIFQLIQKSGNVAEDDMRRACNLGIGLVIIVAKKAVTGIMNLLQTEKEVPRIIGEVVRKIK